MVEGRIVTAGLMFAFFVFMVGFAFTYPPEARFVPLVIGVPGFIFSLIQLVNEVRVGEVFKSTPEERSRELRMFAWYAVFVFGITAFGFAYGGPVIIATYLIVSWNEKWYVALGAAAAAWAVLHYIFSVVLGLPLFEGLVIQWLFF